MLDEPLPETVLRIFELQQQSPMNAWVGGGPVRDIAEGNLETIRSQVPLAANGAVLDFGCGIGRNAAILSDVLRGGQVVGIDIMREAVQFCVDHLQPALANTRFHLMGDKNPLYDRFNEAAHPAGGAVAEEDPATLAQRYAGRFDGVVAFSVFTHFDPAMARRYLDFLFAVTKRSSWVLLTAFLDCPWRPEHHRLTPADDGFRDCDVGMPLNFALFSTERFLRIADEAGFRVFRITFGRMDGNVPFDMRTGHHPHDVLVLTKVPRLPPDFDGAAYLRANPDVAARNGDPAFHYLHWGFFEMRRMR